MPWFYLLLPQTNQEHIAGRSIFLKCFMAHFLCSKVIRDKYQRVWAFLNCLITHFLGVKMIRDMPQHTWALSHCLATHFLCFKTVRDIAGPASTAFSHIPLALR